MSEYQLRARIPHELADEVKAIVEDINEHIPEAEATFSTIARVALHEYVRKNQLGPAVFIEIPMEGRSLDELNKIDAALTLLEGITDVSKAKEKVKSDISFAEIRVLMEQRRGKQNG